MSRALLAAAMSGALVGAAIVVSRHAVAEVPPLTLAMLRYGVGFLCLLPFTFGPLRAAMRTGRPLFARADVMPIALLGMGQFAILIALMNYGLQHLAAAPAALVFSLFPLLTLLLSAALGQERITGALPGGVALSIAGVALSLAPRLGAGVSGQPGHWWGEAAVLASAAVGAVCSILYRPYLRRYPPLTVSAFAMLASVALLAVLALREDWPSHLGHFSAQAWQAVAFIGVSSGIGYYLWLYALKHEAPTRVTIFLALNPITAAVLAALFLGEPMTGWTLSAIALISAGLALATRAGRGMALAAGQDVEPIIRR